MVPSVERGTALRWTLCVLFVACTQASKVHPNSDDGGGNGDTDVDGETDDTDDTDENEEVDRTAATPVAPDADTFMGQGVQTSFRDSEGNLCAGRIALGLGDQALCYVDLGGSLQCAGRIFEATFGTEFAAAGLTEVDQVLVTMTVNAQNGNAACALSGGVPTCMGYWNFSGQFGSGSTDSLEAWAPWDASFEDGNLLATGTTDSYCALDGAGAGWCTGDGLGTTPQMQSEGPHTGVYINTFGEVYFDPEGVWRASQGRAACTVGPDGLTCRTYGNPARMGVPGHVVDGGYSGGDGAQGGVVWLEDDGRVHYRPGDPQGSARLMFTDQPVLAIAYNYYTDAKCAVYADGSLACMGSNDQGMLGTGDTAYVHTATLVLPAGTFDPGCE